MLLILKPLIIGLIIVLFLVMFNFILAVAIALKNGKFDRDKFLKFLKTDMGPYVLIWVFLTAVSVGIPYLVKWLGYDIGLGTIIPIDIIIGLVWGAIVTKAVTDIIKNLKEGFVIEVKNTG